MKAGWQERPFESCLDRFKVTAKVPKKQFADEGQYPIVSQEADFINGYWQNKADVCEIEAPVVIYGDHTQVVKYVDFDFVVGADGVKVLKPRDFITPKYLYYFVMAHRVPSLGYARHYRHLKDQTVKYPPIEEQKRIVAVLDAAFEGLARARARAEANLQNARELFESVLNNSISQFSGDSEQRRLEDLISISHGFAFKSQDFSVSKNSSFPIVLTPGNYTEDSVLNFTDKNTKRLMGEAPPDLLFKPGELTVVMTDLSSKMKILGKPAFIEKEGILHNQRIGRIHFKTKELNARFLFHFLRTQAAQKPIRETATGTMVRHTAPKRILNLTMKTPVSFSDQERIATQIDEVEAETIKIRAGYTKHLQDLDDLRQSLLQKAFAGELT